MNVKETIMDALSHALENMPERSLKIFKRKLSSYNVPSSYKKIPSNVLDGKSAIEVAEILIRYYTISDGPDIAVQVLQEINECQVSQDLQESIQKVSTKKVNMEEKTPGKGSADRLEDTTNKMTSRPHRKRHQRQEYGKENLADLEHSYQTSNDYSHPKATKKVRRCLNMSTAENTGQTSRNNGRSLMPSHPRRRHQPDILLAELTDTNLEIMDENHEGKVQRFACLLFKHFVPFDKYQTWTKNTNFDGSRGKYALPENLLHAIMKEVRKKFSLKQEDKRKIKVSINELLSKPRLDE